MKTTKHSSNVKTVTRLFLLPFILLAIGVSFTSCEKDEDESSPSLQEVHDFLSPEVVNAMVDLGLTLHTGDNPPNIKGLYLSELVLEDSSVPNESAPIGHRFPDWKFRFSQQNGSSIYVEEFEDASGTTGSGYGGLIIGEGELFTVLVKQELTDGTGHTYTNVRAISGDRYGTMEQTVSILDFQLATFMMDNNGNPNGNLLPNNTGRLFSDENNAASRINDSDGGGSSETSGYNCVSGDCLFVSKDATYSSLTACESACGDEETEGKITFFTTSNLGCGNISVSVSGQGTETISTYYPNGIVECDKSGCANFTLPPGDYTFSASCEGTQWGPADFSITADGCVKFELY